MSKTKENKRIARRFVEEIINQQNLVAIDEITMPEWTIHHHLGSEERQTPAGYREMLSGVFKAFPDLHYEITFIMGEGDHVIVFVTVTCTFKNQWRKVRPTSKTGSFAGCLLFRFLDGRITEEWLVYDSAAREKLLGTYGKSS